MPGLLIHGTFHSLYTVNIYCNSSLLKDRAFHTNMDPGTMDTDLLTSNIGRQIFLPSFHTVHCVFQPVQSLLKDFVLTRRIVRSQKSVLLCFRNDQLP